MKVSCLLFNDLEVELGLEDGDNNAGSSTRAVPQVYALFYCKTNKECGPILKAFSSSCVHVIRNEKITLPQDRPFQVSEIQVKVHSDPVQGTPIYVYCSSDDIDSVKIIFNRSSQVKVTLTPIDKYSFKELISKDVISADSLSLIEKLFVKRPDILFRGSQDTLLHFALKRGHTALFEMLLKHKMDINRKNKSGLTPLHVAVDKNHQIRQRVAFARKLLEEGADVNAKTVDMITPLHTAVKSGSQEVTRLLIQNGAEINAASKDGTTPLHIAAGLPGKNEPMVNLLLKAGANIHAADTKGATPLLYSARMLPQVLQLLIEKGAELNVETTEGRTVLLEAVERGWEKSVNYILDLGPNTSLEGNKTALYVALRKEGWKFDEMVERMLILGFTISSSDASKPDVFYGVVQKGLVEIVRRFLDNGAKVNQCHRFMNRKQTPLQVAVWYQQEDVVRLLLDRGADVNATRAGKSFKHLGETPLEDAVTWQNTKIVKMLLDANPNDRTDPKLLFSAVDRQAYAPYRQGMVEFLLEQDFDPNAVISNGSTCMSIALRRDNSCIDLLTKFGARCSYSDLAHKEVFNYAPLKQFLDHCSSDITADGRNAIRSLYNDDSTTLFSCFKADVLLAEHLVKMEALNSEVNVEDLVPKEQYTKFGLSRLKEQCKVEIEKMKKIFDGTDVTFYDILTRDIYRVACYCRNDNIVASMVATLEEQRFPIYSSLLNCKFTMGVQLRNLQDIATPILKFLFSQFSPLPDDVVEIIMRLLKNRDLIVLTKYLPLKQLIRLKRYSMIFTTNA